MQKLPPGFIDIHSHLLPVQDGPKDMGQAIQALRIAEETNITDMILTPHFYSGDRGYDQRHILDTFERLKSEIARNGLKIRVYLGNECVVDEKLLEDLQSGKALTLNHSEYVLCEFPYLQIPCNYQSIIYSLIDKGYLPIIAHPERNAFIDKYQHCIMELRYNGCMIQMNAGSILGKYGRSIRKNSFRFLKEKLCDFIATDAHSDRIRVADVLYQSMIWINKLADKEYLIKIIVKNPVNILNKGNYLAERD